MTTVEGKAGDLVIDAALLVAAFDLSQDEVKARMRDGAITSRCEAGVDSDAGRWRLTFQYGGRACRFVVNEAGDILTTACFPIRITAHDPGAGSAAKDR